MRRTVEDNDELAPKKAFSFLALADSNSRSNRPTPDAR
jgi:hypothetical protein